MPKRSTSVDVDNEAAVPSLPEAKKQKKPLPPGYTCNGCGTVGEHAIYDCPKRVKKISTAGKLRNEFPYGSA